jgi:hypothetical protein
MRLMERIHSGWLRGKAFLRRGQLERDLDDELRFHLAQREEDYGAAGLSPDEAHHAARRRFGNPVSLKEACCDLWTYTTLESLWQDFRFGDRQLHRSPGTQTDAQDALAHLVDAIFLRRIAHRFSSRR